MSIKLLPLLHIVVKDKLIMKCTLECSARGEAWVCLDKGWYVQ